MGTIGIKLSDPVGLAVLDYTEYYAPDAWYITRINVPRSHRGKGIASKLLNRFLAMADEQNITVWLEIQPSDGLTYDELEAWYLRHGFKGFMIYKRLKREKRHEGE